MKENIDVYSAKVLFDLPIYIISEGQAEQVNQVAEPAKEPVKEPAQPVLSTPKLNIPAVSAPVEKKKLIEKDTILIFSSPNDPTDLDFLSKVLKAVNLHIDKTLWLVEKEIETEKIKETHIFNNVICFESSLKDISGLIKYKITDKGFKILLADNIKAIQKEDTKKKQLWAALKEMYKV
ncbi:MAG: hypothetical protein ACK40G_08560 [Cytophagaceae bacterium]